MTDIKLRPYQQKFIDDVRNEFLNNHKRVVGVAPCGAGKTIMTGWMIREALNRGKRSIFFVHRHELIEQTSKTFTALDIPHGIISAGCDMNLNLPVQIASVQTLAKRIEQVPPPDFLICDECHHILANTYKKILDKFPAAFLLGVTATPIRMGGITLSDVFSSMVPAPSVNQLIKLGNLTKFDYFAAPLNINLDNVQIRNGDFDSKDLSKIMDSKKITGNIIYHYLKFANGKSSICYCVNVKHSKSVANAFNDAGIPAAHVDGDTPQKIRSQIVDDFRHNKIKILCNAELFGEGFDVPNCQAVILARPTMSLTLFIQQSMRPLRPDPNDTNKRAVIIDCVQNCNRHGLPNDYREWSLEPSIKKTCLCPACGNFIVKTTFTKKEDTPLKFKIEEGRIFLKDSFDKDGEPIKLALDFIEGTDILIAVVEDNQIGRVMKICPECGYLFPLQAAPDTAPPQPKYQDGELNKVDVPFDDENYLESSVIHKDTSPETFLKIAKKKHYKIGWVAFNSLLFANSYEDCKHIADVCGYKAGWAFHMWNELKTQRA